MTLWAHQRQAVEFVRELTLRGSGRSLICMPPGSGKSEIAIASVLDWLSTSCMHRAVVCVPSNRLLAQFYYRLVRLTSERIDFEQGQRRASRYSRLTLASQLSLVDRLNSYDDNAIVVIDEAHHSSYDAPIFNSVLSTFRRAIGLTATPWTNGLVKLFQRSYFYGITEAINDRVVSPIEIVRAETLEPSAHPLTLVFVATNEAARLMSQRFPKSDWIGHSRDDSENFAALDRWKSCRTNTLFSNRMLLEGYDLPDIDSIWIDMNIKSHVMCAQVMGRALRYREGKKARIFVLSDETEHTARQALRMLDLKPRQRIV